MEVAGSQGGFILLLGKYAFKLPPEGRSMIAAMILRKAEFIVVGEFPDVVDTG